MTFSHQAVWYSCVCSDAKDFRRLRLVPAYTLEHEDGFKYRLCLYILDTDYIGRDYTVSEYRFLSLRWSHIG